MAALPVTPVPSPEPATPALSQVERVFDTFVAPGKTFSDLRRSASWWMPWLLISIVSLAFVYTIDRKIGFEQITRSQIARSPRADQFEKLPPDQRANQIQMTSNILRYSIYAAPVLNLLVFAIIAAVLMGAFNFGAGASVPFKVAFAIVVYGSLPTVISAILGIASMLAGVDPEGFNVQNPVATNPAYFMDPAANKFMYGMASALDVFVIWNIVLLGIGFACNSKVKRSTAIALVAGFYLVYKLVASGLGSLG